MPLLFPLLMQEGKQKAGTKKNACFLPRFLCVGCFLFSCRCLCCFLLVFLCRCLCWRLCCYFIIIKCLYISFLVGLWACLLACRALCCVGLALLKTPRNGLYSRNTFEINYVYTGLFSSDQCIKSEIVRNIITKI